MSDVFISYARSTEKQAQQIADALRSLGHNIWRDDELPAHRAYTEVIEERLKAAKAVVVVWSAEAVKSQWVRAEADIAREAGTLVQLRVDGSTPPLPFNQIQCADLAGWSGDLEAPGWRKVVASIADLVGGTGVSAPPVTAAPLPLPTKPSIAVLPFANLSGDPEQDYFADGMVVEIVEALSRIKSIFVIASGSTLAFKGKGVGPQDAARQLGVRYVLGGSVRQAGGRVRIGVQLIDAEDGAQIWTHRFEDTLEDVFALQDRVALAVAGKIEPTVRQAEIRRAVARPTDNMGSYDLYLRAMTLAPGSKADVLSALDLFRRAIALDPEFAPALSYAAYCCYRINLYGWSDDAEGNRRLGAEMAGRALKAAGDDATAMARAALVMSRLGGDTGAALSLVDRATVLNPGSSMAWLYSGILRLTLGEADLAAEHIEMAMRLDPMGPNRAGQIGILGEARFLQGRVGEAADLLKEAAQQLENPGLLGFLAASLGQLGQLEAAREAMARYRKLTDVPFEDQVRSIFLSAAAVALVLNGIALAEGKTPAGG
ncbi:MAG TPA: TIR domain-containing protein [Caulobacteraceae bacterium]|nr:TIR domain-containing protein [Caulobacteraceae bacterium]